MSNPTLIIPLTKKEARESGITRPVTRTQMQTPLELRLCEKEVKRLTSAGIPAAIVVEKTTRQSRHIAVWRGNPPKAARTSHQFRKEQHVAFA